MILIVKKHNIHNPLSTIHNPHTIDNLLKYNIILISIYKPNITEFIPFFFSYNLLFHFAPC